MVGQVTYTVRVSREGRYWVAEVDGVPGGATEVRRLVELDGEVRDLLAGLLDVEEESLVLRYDFSPAFGDETARAWERFEREREELYAQQRRVEEDRLQVIRELREQGVSMRDVGGLVDLSHQRVAQLLQA